jgi:hypothetical protein
MRIGARDAVSIDGRATLTNGGRFLPLKVGGRRGIEDTKQETAEFTARDEPVQRFERLLRLLPIHGDQFLFFLLPEVGELDGQAVDLDIGLAGAVGTLHLFGADEIRQLTGVMDGDFPGGIQCVLLVLRGGPLGGRRDA